MAVTRRYYYRVALDAFPFIFTGDCTMSDILPTDGLVLAIYKNGQMVRIDMSAGELRNIGQQLIAMADNVVIRGTMPQEARADVEDNVGLGDD